MQTLDSARQPPPTPGPGNTGDLGLHAARWRRGGATGSVRLIIFLHLPRSGYAGELVEQAQFLMSQVSRMETLSVPSSSTIHSHPGSLRTCR